jgi:RHS repeat-associated protein
MSSRCSLYSATTRVTSALPCQFSSPIFDPAITDATDYFPFGAPNRTVSSTAGYRYGFNGKELDKNNEFGTANVYDYGFRIYNPSIGRFLSVDPLTRSYPELTPYQFASNTPIKAIDLDGLEAWTVVYNHIPNQTKPVLKWYYNAKKANIEQVYVVHKYWDGNGNLTFKRTTTADFSKFPAEFPRNGKLFRDDNKPLFTLEGSAQLLYGEAAFTYKGVGVELGVEGEIAGLEVSSARNEKNEYSKGSTMDGADPDWNIGGGIAYGHGSLEFRKKYKPATGEWSPAIIEKDWAPYSIPSWQSERIRI